MISGIKLILYFDENEYLVPGQMVDSRMIEKITTFYSINGSMTCILYGLETMQLLKKYVDWVLCIEKIAYTTQAHYERNQISFPLIQN